MLIGEHLGLQGKVPHNTLNDQACGTGPKHRQGPWVAALLDLGPEAVLCLLIFRELAGLDRVLGIFLLLVCLILRITTHVSQEGVVGDGAEDGDGVELAGTPQEERERQVNECVTEVAEYRSISKWPLEKHGRILTWDGGRCSIRPRGSA